MKPEQIVQDLAQLAREAVELWERFREVDPALIRRAAPKGWDFMESGLARDRRNQREFWQLLDAQRRSKQRMDKLADDIVSDIETALQWAQAGKPGPAAAALRACLQEIQKQKDGALLSAVIDKLAVLMVALDKAHK